MLPGSCPEAMVANAASLSKESSNLCTITFLFGPVCGAVGQCHLTDSVGLVQISRSLYKIEWCKSAI